MTKTLVTILNHNLPEYTNWLYNELSRYEGNTYEVKVVDNGSEPQYLPEKVHIHFEKNLFWGGALNKAFTFVLNNSHYDSLLFLNNDIELTSEIFVDRLREILFKEHLAIVSPCIAGRAQPWKQMQNWGSPYTRIVKWIDNQAPLFHRKLIEAIGQFDKELYYGWGQELICHDVCEHNGWKIGVSDQICILHYGMQTLKQNRLFKADGTTVQPVPLMESHAKAMEEYQLYFRMNPLRYGNFDELRHYGESYLFKPDSGLTRYTKLLYRLIVK